MQQKRLCMLTIAFLLTCLSPSAFAVMMSIPYGWYAELNGGVTKITDASFPGSPKSLSGLGANLNIGYKFMPFIGTEFGYTAYSSTTIQDQFGTTAGEISHYLVDVAIRGIVPIGDSGFEFFTRLGWGWLFAHYSVTNSAAAANIGATSSTRNTASGFYMALGGQYYFSPATAVNFQWSRGHGNDSTGTLDLYAIGISVIFG